MIHVFFVPGMFGSTIEYVLRDFTNEMTPTNAAIAEDGSMHTFAKKNHPTSELMLTAMPLKEINTPIYPLKELHLPEILESYPVSTNDHCILIYANSFEEAERNILFQYHKISQGLKSRLEMFYGNPEDVKQWNSNYTDYTDLAPWEFREWFSIFYPAWIQEWQDSHALVPSKWLKISANSILFDTKNTFENIINFCALTQKRELDDFVNQWQQAQSYILNEYALINSIVDSTIKQQEYNWEPLHILAEAMIQQKLRAKGFEIRCDGLNIFPTNSIDLYNLLEDQLQLHKQEIQS